MNFRPADRLKMVWTGTGTGSVNATSAVNAKFQTFASAGFVTGDKVYYVIEHPALLEAEVGEGTYDAGVLLRDGAISFSTNSNALVNFSSGDKYVYVALTKKAIRMIAVAFKHPVRLATAAALPSNTYNSTTKRLTATANAALTVDGVAVAVDNRILVKDESTGSNRGVYKVIQVGSGSLPYILERTLDAWESADFQSGMLIPVAEGTANGKKVWLLETADPITLDTTSLTFRDPVAAATSALTAGAGLTRTGDTFDVGTASSSRIIVNADNIDTGTDVPLKSTTNTFAAKQTFQGPGSSSSFGAIASFAANPDTAGNIYSIEVAKGSTEGLFCGVNKDSATGEIPANAVFISTYSATGIIAIGQGASNGLPNAARILIRTSELVLNEGGNDYDLRVEGVGDDDLFIIDASTGRIGVGLFVTFGGVTTSFPALKRSSANLQVRLADDSAFTDLEVADEAYGAGWNGSLEVPTKNAVYDKIETVVSGGQPADGDLTAIAALTGTGILARTGTDTWALRTITGTGTNISVSQGDGVSGNPTIDVGANIPKIDASNIFTATGNVFPRLRIEDGSEYLDILPNSPSNFVTLTTPNSHMKLASGGRFEIDMATGGDYTLFSVGGTEVARISGNGTATFTGDVTVPDETYGAGWNGSLEVPTKNAVYDKIETFAGADADIVAIAALTGTGILVRTAADTWTLRSIAGTGTNISVSNGDGVSGNPTIDVGSNIPKKDATNTFTQLNTFEQTLASADTWYPFIQLRQTTGHADARSAIEWYSTNDSYVMAQIGAQPGAGYDAPKWIVRVSDTSHVLQDRLSIDSAGVATFSGDVVVPDEAYGAGWNGSLEVPTKNAVYDKIETVAQLAASNDFSSSGGNVFQYGIIVNEGGHDSDSRFEGDAEPNLTFWDASTDRVGFGTSAPQARVHVHAGALGDNVFSLTSPATNDDPVLNVYQNRVATTDATTTVLHTLTLADDSVYFLEARVLARRTGGTAGTAGDIAVYMLRCVARRTGGGSVDLPASFSTEFSVESVSTYACEFNASGNDLRVRVTGVLNTNITWHLSELKVSSLST